MDLNWYKCKPCGRVFSEDDAATRFELESSEFWGGHAVTRSTYLMCPSCGKEDFGSHDACHACVESGEPEPREALEGCDYCRDCLEELDPEALEDWLDEGDTCHVEKVTG